MKTTWASVGVLLLAFLYPCVSNADCAPEQRKVVLDKSAAEGGKSVVKSYRCSLQPQSKNADLRVEFYRANEETAALILAGGGSKKLRLTLGSPKVLNNDVWQFYADLVNAFGITEEIPPEPLSSFNVGGASTPDVVSVKKFRHLDNSIHVSNVFCPAVDEIAALRKKTFPSDLSYFYKNSGCEAGTADCEKLGDDRSPWSSGGQWSRRTLRIMPRGRLPTTLMYGRRGRVARATDAPSPLARPSCCSSWRARAARTGRTTSSS